MLIDMMITLEGRTSISGTRECDISPHLHSSKKDKGQMYDIFSDLLRYLS